MACGMSARQSLQAPLVRIFNTAIRHMPKRAARRRKERRRE